MTQILKLLGLEVVYVVPAWALLIAIGIRANKEGFWTMADARAHTLDPGMKVASLSQHAGYLGSYIVAVIAAVIIERYGMYWRTGPMVWAGFFWAIAFTLGPQQNWAHKSLTLNESLARGGNVTLPGVMLDMFIVYVLTVLTLFFISTPRAQGSFDAWMVLGVAGALIVFTFFGVILPEIVTHKTIRSYAAYLAFAMIAALIFGAWYRLHLA